MVTLLFNYSHSLESYTAIPYNQRSPRPTNPMYRPAYQGSNPISDIWSLKSLKMCIDNLPNAYKRQDDHYAQEQMILAATFAGIGFGNAGVHLCHGMSYPISGLNKSYVHPGYSQDKALVVRIHLISLMEYLLHCLLQQYLNLLLQPILTDTWNALHYLGLT